MVCSRHAHQKQSKDALSAAQALQPSCSSYLLQRVDVKDDPDEVLDRRVERRPSRWRLRRPGEPARARGGAAVAVLLVVVAAIVDVDEVEAARLLLKRLAVRPRVLGLFQEQTLKLCCCPRFPPALAPSVSQARQGPALVKAPPTSRPRPRQGPALVPPSSRPRPRQGPRKGPSSRPWSTHRGRRRRARRTPRAWSRRRSSRRGPTHGTRSCVRQAGVPGIRGRVQPGDDPCGQGGSRSGGPYQPARLSYSSTCSL